ncbi:MAG: phosphotriesterase family protein [Anaerolineae bacterium]
MMHYFQTVNGPRPETEMGITSTHEHLLWDQRCYLPPEPQDPEERAFRCSPVNLANLGRIRYHMHRHADNLVQLDEELAAAEAGEFRTAGGRTICECSDYGLGRNPQALCRIAAASGLNILMGTGLYIEQAHPDWMRAMTVSQLAELFIRELQQGVGESGIRAGFIGEIGVSTFSEAEQRVLAAAALAQKETGAALVIHQPGLDPLAVPILDLVERLGADLRKVVMAHSDIFERDLPYQQAIMARGANIAFDQFGIEIAIDYRIWLPRDIDRVRAIARHIAAGYGRQIVLGQDVCFKVSLKKYGGWGYSHLLENIVPIMRVEGFSQADIDQLLIHNPRAVFCH